MKAFYQIRRPQPLRPPRSLRKHLIIGLLVSTVVPILLIGAVSYYILYTILDNKAAGAIKSTLHQVRTNVEKTYDNLNYVSQQLTGKSVQLLYQSTDPVERYLLSQQVYEQLQLVSFTNPETGLFFLSLPSTKEMVYQNQPPRTGVDSQELPVLTTKKGVTYFVPHRTFSYGDEQVLSVSRPVNILKNSDMTIYVETNAGLYDQLLNERQYGMKVIQVMTDESGKIVFSQDPIRFAPGAAVSQRNNEEGYHLAGGYYYFHERSPNQGWSIYAIVHKSSFQQEIRNWSIAWAAIGAASLLFSIWIGWLIWRMVYFPLTKLNREIHELGGSRLEDESLVRQRIRLTQIAEFDVLLNKFENMRIHIWSLLNELKRKEADKRQLEVDKLVAQINPHFLYNTLNTVQWLAKSKGDQEIVNLVTVFIRLLRYNLGKDGGLISLGRELEALRDYMILQQIRYNYEFQVEISADPQALNVPVPRFLLQPLLENALYHGQPKEGKAIELTVSAEEGKAFRVEIKDNGIGMSDEEIARLLLPIDEREKVGMGIGLNYVHTMLKVHFGSEAGLQISSSPEWGTKMEFCIPVQGRWIKGTGITKGGETHD